MRFNKLFINFFLIFLFFYLFFSFKNQVLAANSSQAICEITAPTTITDCDACRDFTIKTEGLVNDKDYGILLNGVYLGFRKQTNNEIKGRLCPFTINPSQWNWENKAYVVTITQSTVTGTVTGTGGDAYCSATFYVDQDPDPGKKDCRKSACTIDFDSSNNYAYGNPVKFKVNDVPKHSNDWKDYLKLLIGSLPDRYRVVLRSKTINGSTINHVLGVGVPYSSDKLAKGVTIGTGLTFEDPKFNVGTYYLEIRNSFNGLGLGEDKLCSETFTICRDGNSRNCGPRSSKENPIPCPDDKDHRNKGLCTKIDTALGPISVEPSKFVTSIFGIILSLSGGIAVMLIILSGYKMMMSRGDPEKLKDAKETLTSAIVGLLFIIFALAILQFIGVDIFKIPGFKK